MMRRTKILLATLTVAVMAAVGAGATTPATAAVQPALHTGNNWCC